MADTDGLSILASQINASHEAFVDSSRSALERGKECGQFLLQAKAQVRHGQWLKWLKANINCSVRTAQYYIKVAEHWDELVQKNAVVAYSTLRSAIKFLEQPKPSEYMSAEEYQSEPQQRFRAFVQELFAAEPEWSGRRDQVLGCEKRAETLNERVNQLQRKASKVKTQAESLRYRLERDLKYEFARREQSEAAEHPGLAAVQLAVLQA